MPGAATQGRMDDMRLLRNVFHRWIVPLLSVVERWWHNSFQ
jgi:hypothetical protein